MYYVKTIRHLLLVLVLSGGWVLTSSAQTTVPGRPSERSGLSKKERRKLRPAYIGVNVGTNRIKFRDFATSPLFYEGWTTYVGASWLKADRYRESEAALTYSFGNPKTDFNENATSSNFNRFELFYSQLYQVGAWSNSNFTTKVGGMFNTTGNLRANPKLGNNALGLEAFPTLFFSFKLTKEMSGSAKNARRQNLSLRVNTGIINAAYRNGYIYYPGQGTEVNEPNTFENYELNVSGFRASTGLDYTRYLRNKNALQISYIWDTYHTGGDLDRFEMANHTLKFALLFNTNNQ
ncbi:hypothetical protein [Tunicatimonas pelagia]|uniref:hypothetical protein n=1 Tax=Tunicatimonas pelagia TaxID=931531 RepID=UPI00266657EA|nr:hypothetical protein [Tunicatimonas pelagia]WKN40561.1 hypothetical protein P0M28_16095 [Tunicatimonas pelagia]